MVSQPGGARTVVPPPACLHATSLEAAGTTYRVSGGNIVPPPPISLQEVGRFRVFCADVSEVSQRPQLLPRERVSPRSRAPSISSQSRPFRVRLPPPPLPISLAFGERQGSLMASLPRRRPLKLAYFQTFATREAASGVHGVSSGGSVSRECVVRSPTLRASNADAIPRIDVVECLGSVQLHNAGGWRNA